MMLVELADTSGIKHKKSMTITWKSHWDTGIAEIDAQHQRIAAHINKLGREMPLSQNDAPINHEHDDDEYAHYAALFGSLSTGGFAYALDAFIECLELHFAFEENLHQTDNYALATAHKETHDLFMQRIKKYREQFKNDEAVAPKLHRITKNWLEKHIASDLKYIALTKPHLSTAVAADVGQKKLDWLLHPFKARSKHPKHP